MKKIKIVAIVVVLIGLSGLYAFGTWPKDLYNTNVGSSAYKNVGEITGDTEVAQIFVCPNNGLYEIDVLLSTLDHENLGNYLWEVIETKTNNKIAQGKISVNEINNSEKYKLKFDSINNSAKKEYKLVLKAKDVPETQGITMITTDGIQKNTKLIVQGNEVNKTGIVTLQTKRFNVETFIVLLGLIACIILFIRFLLRLFK